MKKKYKCKDEKLFVKKLTQENEEFGTNIDLKYFYELMISWL